MLASHLEINLGQQKVVTYSFNPSTMMCLCNATHSKSKKATTRSEGRGGMEVIFLTELSGGPPSTWFNEVHQTGADGARAAA
jgi:mannose/fructose-specific phosphotransferase system component IIA